MAEAERRCVLMARGKAAECLALLRRSAAADGLAGLALSSSDR